MGSVARGRRAYGRITRSLARDKGTQSLRTLSADESGPQIANLERGFEGSRSFCVRLNLASWLFVTDRRNHLTSPSNAAPDGFALIFWGSHRDSTSIMALYVIFRLVRKSSVFLRRNYILAWLFI